MYPSIGETAKYSFISAFQALDGIYTLNSVYTLDDLLELDISLVDTTYAAVGLTENDYQAELDDFKDDDIFKLTHVTTADVIYIPVSFNLYIPNPNVKPYLKLGLGVEVGIYKEEDTINWIKEQIGQVLTAVAGVEKTPVLFEISKQWLTDGEYADVVAAREAVISLTSNHYVDKQKLIQENTRLKQLIDQYEATLINLSTGG